MLRTLVITLTVTMVAAAGAHAATVHVAPSGSDVPGCGSASGAGACQTIGFGIGQAAAGDTVQVAAGTYAVAAPIDVTTPVVLRGAQAGVDARTRSVSASLESMITGTGTALVQFSASGAVLDGFTVAGNPAGPGVLTLQTASGHHIENTIFTDNVMGLYLNAAGGTQTVVTRNRFTANNRAGAASGNGIYSDFGLRDAFVSQNLFTGHANSPIVVDGSVGSIPSAGLTVTANTFSGENSLVLAAIDDVVVDGNLFDGGAFDAVSASGNVDRLAVRSNVIRNKGRDGVRIRNTFGYGPNSLISIVGNEITGSGGNPPPGQQGAAVRLLGGATSTPVEAHFNRIVGNSDGVRSDDAASPVVNAQNNWWGCNSGPGASGCDPTAGPGAIVADPWLVLRIAANPPTVAATGQTQIRVWLDENSAGVVVNEPLFPSQTISLTSTLGTLGASTGTLSATPAALTTPYTAGSLTGAGSVTATLDAATPTVTFPVTAAPRPRLSLAIRSQATVRVGRVATFRLTVRNGGTVTATGVRLRFVMPAGFAARTSSGCGRATLRGRTVSIRAAALAPGRRCVATITARAVAPALGRQPVTAASAGGNAVPASARGTVRVLGTIVVPSVTG